ncbi:MAG TPA: TonB-dependent receptor [Allosphingosinicella sp.]|uniref:TonB-dependent receptor plug domain-containing protein n=1 Tax=Allosphingosinicella sp. TaxID=2823234 RepID=UPI002EDA26EF
MFSVLLSAAAHAAIKSPTASAADEDIVVTASLLPLAEAEATGSVTLFDEAEIEALAEPFVADYLRLVPGGSVSVAGSPGAQAQVRIRGAEANQTLLFVDGIAFNDVASDGAARFETISADGLGRIEVIRGPQSALWGSEALGGVIAIETPNPLGERRASLLGEYGSLDSARLAGAFVSGGETAGLTATASWSRSDGIDILGGGTGDRDGYENYGGSLKGVTRLGADTEIGAVGRYVRHYFEFDGTDDNFRRADTAEKSVAETYAVRGWAKYGLGDNAPWSILAQAQFLDSENRNSDGEVRTNDTLGKRTRFGAQGTRRFESGGGRHALIGAIEREEEEFGTRDLLFGGGRDVDYDRGRTAFTGEWRANWGTSLTTDVALRHDRFNRFKDETTFRAGAILGIGGGFSLLGSYGEGIVQPGFAELFGYAPDSGFVGNPALTPEKSNGFEAGLRWAGQKASLELVGFSNNLRNEIVYSQLTPFPASTYTYVNAEGKSRRRGVELSGEWRPVDGLSLGGNYTLLDAREADSGPGEPLREIRRPRHSGNLYGVWERGPLSLGASAAYVGKRRDTDFDTYSDVTLGDYLLIGARIGYALQPNVEAFGRVDNLGDADYVDLVGYNTPGRTVHAGLRLRLGR